MNLQNVNSYKLLIMLNVFLSVGVIALGVITYQQQKQIIDLQRDVRYYNQSFEVGELEQKVNALTYSVNRQDDRIDDLKKEMDDANQDIDNIIKYLNGARYKSTYNNPKSYYTYP